MNFISNNTDFSNKLKPLITLTGYTIVCNIGSEPIHTPNIDNLIQLFSIDNISDYYDSMKHGTVKMAENYNSTTNSCTNIYVFMHEYITPKEVAEVINTFDKVNLVDHIFIYPKVPTLQLRENEVSKLPWQKKINGLPS